MTRTPSNPPSLPGRLLRAWGLSAATVLVTVVVGFALASYEVFHLHQVDPKWGDEWANVSLVVWVMAFTALAQAVLLFALLVSPVFSPLLFAARARFACLLSFVVLTVVLYPPKARFPLPTGVAVVAVSAALGLIFAARSAPGRPMPPAAPPEPR